MMRLYSSLEMKKVDNYAIETLQIPSLALMERASVCVASEIEKDFSKNTKILAVCGVGNNGADGLATIRILSTMGFTKCDAVQVGSDEKATKEFSLQKQILSNLDINVKKIENEKELTMDMQSFDFSEYDVIVDALFGIGLVREVSGIFKDVIEAINKSNVPVYAIDIPSGIDGNTGKMLGSAIVATKTITFGACKVGLVLKGGTQHTGKIEVCNIGFPKQAYENRTYYNAFEKSDIFEYLPKRKPNSNKGTYGKLLIIAGNEDMYGAAYLCSAAAFSLGVGLIKVMTTENNKHLLNEKLPEAIVIAYKEDDLKEKLENELLWCDSILIGPGMGVSENTRIAITKALATKKKIIIDADALNTISKYVELKNKLHENVVITPHVGEASRLTGLDIPYISDNIIDVCKKISKEYKISCVLKDARTVISDRNGSTYINLSGNNGMAKAGSGDVLAGIIAGLVSTGLDIEKAAAFGPYIHGLAGDKARDNKNLYSMMPSDIIEAIPQIIV